MCEREKCVREREREIRDRSHGNMLKDYALLLIIGTRVEEKVLAPALTKLRNQYTVLKHEDIYMKAEVIIRLAVMRRLII